MFNPEKFEPQNSEEIKKNAENFGLELEKDEKLARKIATVLFNIDKIVFAENPIQKVEIIHKIPGGREKESHFHYVHGKQDKSGSGEHYEVFVNGMRECIEKEIKGKKHLLLAKKEKGDWVNIIPFSEEEVIIAIAAHEIRHRLQEISSIEKFSLKNAGEISSLKNLIELVKKLFEIKPSKGNQEKEFDAKVVEYIAAGWFHQGKDQPSDLVQAITAEPKSFEKNKESF